jgi:hypothetical protein
MLDQFLSNLTRDRDEDLRGAYELAWRPVGSRPLSAAISAPQCRGPIASRPPQPSFELLVDL